MANLSRRSFLKASALLTGVAGAGGALAACGETPSENSKNAVGIGGTFQFHTPGGQTVIHYEEADRKPLAHFEGESLMEEGKTITLDDFAGQIVVLNAWGQWCAPCRAEVDDLQAAQDDLSKDKAGTILGINVKDYNPQISRDFVTDNGVTYPSIYDPPFRSALALGGVPTSVVPTTIILDKKHRPATVFLQEITVDDILKVTDELKKEA